jgi:hypothetical protein
MLLISERILLTLWIGSLWAIGYIAAPSLFHVLDDRQLAGAAAGFLFHVVSYLGLVCGALLLIGAIYRHGQRWLRSWRVWTLIIMLVLVALGEFVLQPAMAGLKAQGFVEDSAAASQFGRLHGMASGLYMVNSLLGLALVIGGLRSREIRAA